jgi:hypothetical protein
MSCRKWHVQILRWHEGALAEEAEALLLQHLGICVHCRTLAEKYEEIDGLFLNSEEPSLPPFLKEKIVNSVSEAMRQDSMSGILSNFFRFLASFRPAVTGAVFVLGIGLGAVTGWTLAQSVFEGATVPSHDLLSLAGFGDSGSGSFLEFIWTDHNRRIGQ